MANRDFGIRNYLSIVFTTLSAVLLAYLIDKNLMKDNAGVLMGILEVSFEIFMFWKLHQLHLIARKGIYRFKWFFFFLAIGDFFYMFLFYFLKLSSRSWYSLLLITFPYTLAYAFGAVMMLGPNLKRFRSLRSKFAMSVYVFCLPLVMRLLVMPFIDNVGSSDGLGFVVVESGALIALYFLLCHSVMTFIASNVFFWSNVSAAMVILVVSDWALRAEKLIDNSPTFGFYEALYCVGVSTMVASFVDFKRLPAIPRFDGLSLSSNVKKITMAAVCASTVFLSLSQYGTRESIRFGILGIIFGVFLVQLIGIYINEQISAFTSRVGRLAQERSMVFDRKSSRLMPLELLEAFHRVVDLQVGLVREKFLIESRSQFQEKLAEKAAQVSHDIRSPLAALEMITSSLNELPEEKRLIVRNSVHRIRDIANELLSENKRKFSDLNSDGQSKDDSDEKVEVVLMEPLIETIVSEKRIQFREYMDKRIDFDLSPSAYGVFAAIRPFAFKRVISNLISNGLESLKDGKGTVRVSLVTADTDSRKVMIKVEDDGVGMSPETLDRLGVKGFTFGKTNGSGIGLHYSISKVKEMGGDLRIASTQAVGTTVQIDLPVAPLPQWAVSSIVLSYDGTVVVFDDDQSIHEVWKRRFDASVIRNDLRILHFSSPIEFQKYYAKNFHDLESALFLIDFEISGFAENGLDLIEKLGIQSQSILVTSHHEEKMIRERCIAMGVKLVPKMMAGFVPIEIQ